MEQKFFRFLKIEIVRRLSPCAINRNLFSEFEIFGEKFSWILSFPLVHVRFIVFQLSWSMHTGKGLNTLPILQFIL